MRWQPLNSKVRRDPYSHYTDALKVADVMPHFPFCYVLGYEANKWVLTHTDPYSSMKQPPQSDLDLGAFRRVIKYILFQFDGPQHKELRDLGTHGLKGINLRAIVESALQSVLADLGEKQDFDFITEWSVPLSISVTCQLLGVPHGDEPLVQRWAEDMFRIAGLFVSKGDFVCMEKAAGEIEDYITGLCSPSYLSHGVGLLPNLMRYYAGQKPGLEQNMERIISWATLIIFSSLETSSGALGNAVFNLLDNPPVFAKLRQSPQLLRQAVEELVRYDPPLQFVSRVLTDDVELEGNSLKKGTPVVACLGAANRDERIFADANTINLERKPNPHLSFGFGEHYCFGARIARLELERSLMVLCEHYPRMVLAPKSKQYKEVNVLKAFSELHVSNIVH